mgnify:CR=1 FL=1
MADENVGGTGLPPAAPTSQPGETAPVAPPEPATAKPVDLTQLPEFRAFQSKADREKAESDRRAAEANAKLNAIQAQLEAIQAERQRSEMQQLEALDPAEQAAAYKRRLAERDAQDRAKAEQARIYAQANAIVSESGLNPADPRLKAVWDMGATPAAIDALTRLAPQIVKQDSEAEKAALKAELEALKRAQPAQAKSETQKAVVAALDKAGVTATSSAPSVIAPVGAEEATMKALRDKWTRNKGKGIDNPAIADVERELRKMGKTSADLFDR